MDRPLFYLQYWWPPRFWFFNCHECQIFILQGSKNSILKKPACASKQDVFQLATLQYLLSCKSNALQFRQESWQKPPGQERARSRLSKPCIPGTARRTTPTTAVWRDFRYCNKDASLALDFAARWCCRRRCHRQDVLLQLSLVLSDFDEGRRTGWHFLEIHAIFNWEIGRRDARSRRCQIGRCLMAPHKGGRKQGSQGAIPLPPPPRFRNYYFVLPIFRFWFLVTFCDKVTKIRKFA